MTKIKTAILMLNMGGPQNLEQVGVFLENIFADRQLIQLPFQAVLGPLIARRRTRRVQENYRRMGGGSPILHWTRQQGAGMTAWLDQLSPETAPHGYYIAFRYIHPYTEEALQEMRQDGVQRAVAFTQYPQWSCSTTGSSLNELWREVQRLQLESAFEWSLIDRWPTAPGFIEAIARSVKQGLEGFESAGREEVVLLFSAHSLPMKVIHRGDAYPQEVAASVQAVVQRLGLPNRYLLAYQSQVGPVAWLGPSTEQAIWGFGAQGCQKLLVIPIAFTCDHIETLYEIDIEFAETARRAGIRQFQRAPAINGDGLFQRGLAEIVVDHFRSGKVCSPQYRLRCPGCTNTACRQIVNPIAE